MRIAVINETSAGDKNSAVVNALEGRGHEVFNAGMTQSGGSPELTYIHTGLLTGILLNTGRADFVVGGCGTGQGYLNAAVQYPGVFCGLILDSLDAWLFTQINGGNAISLALNKGYGWASDVNLGFIFDRIFSVERGGGFPAHRKESQAESRSALEKISRSSHRPFSEIMLSIPEKIMSEALNFPGIIDIIAPEKLEDPELRAVFTALAERLVK